MTEVFPADSAIAEMSADQRRDLIRRLERPLEELISASELRRIHRPRLKLIMVGAIALIPWMVFLAITLPANYVAHNWPATWVGFDALLIAFMVMTAVLALLNRQLLLVTAFTTGVLLICDAWFDVMTAGPHDIWVSAVAAALGELPLALILITGALRILRLTVTRLRILDPDTPLLRLPLLLP